MIGGQPYITREDQEHLKQIADLSIVVAHLRMDAFRFEALLMRRRAEDAKLEAACERVKAALKERRALQSLRGLA